MDYTTQSGADPNIPPIFWVLILAYIVFFLAANWKIFKKAGKPGWAALIPIYNYYILTKIVGRPWWVALLLCIPYLSIVVSIFIALDLAKSFGKDTFFAIVCLFLLPIIGYPILGFGKAKYLGPSALGKS